MKKQAELRYYPKVSSKIFEVETQIKNTPTLRNYA